MRSGWPRIPYPEFPRGPSTCPRVNALRQPPDSGRRHDNHEWHRAQVGDKDPSLRIDRHDASLDAAERARIRRRLFAARRRFRIADASTIFTKTRSPSLIWVPLQLEMTVQIFNGEHRNTVVVEGLQLEKSAASHSYRVITGYEKQFDGPGIGRADGTARKSALPCVRGRC